MAWFKKKVKEDEKHMTTLDQIRKAYENLSDDDKENFRQSIADRIHESIGEQEHDDGDKDSQSAADREHEALGEEHADGKGDVAELHETDPQADDDKGEDKSDKHDDAMSAILSRLDALEAHFREKADDAEDADEEAVKKAEQVYGLGNDVFEAAKRESKNISPQEAAQIVRNLKN